MPGMPAVQRLALLCLATAVCIVCAQDLPATTADKNAEMKEHTVSTASDAKKKAAPEVPMASQMAEGLDPSTAIMGAIAPPDVNPNSTEGSQDAGSIGTDGKRTGKLSAPPSFMFPIILAIGGGIFSTLGFIYMCFFRKEEKVARDRRYI